MCKPCAASFLSGAGPSIMALVSTTSLVDAVSTAMLAAAAAVGVSGSVLITDPTSTPTHVTTSIPVPTYVSTRDPTQAQHSFRFVAMEGLAKDGGLYVPSQVCTGTHMCILFVKAHCLSLLL